MGAREHRRHRRRSASTSTSLLLLILEGVSSGRVQAPSPATATHRNLLGRAACEAVDCGHGLWNPVVCECQPRPSLAATPPHTSTETTPTGAATGGTAEVALEPLSITLFNLTAAVQLDDAQRQALADITRAALLATAHALNVTIREVRVTDSLFSRADATTLPLRGIVVVAGLPRGGGGARAREVRAAFLAALQGRADAVAARLREAWGAGLYAEGVVLGIGAVRATAAAAPDDDAPAAAPDESRGDGDKGAAAWASVLAVAVLMALGGAVAWWRRRNKDRELRPIATKPQHSPFDDEELTVAREEVSSTLSPLALLLEKKAVDNDDELHQLSCRALDRGADNVSLRAPPPLNEGVTPAARGHPPKPEDVDPSPRNRAKPGSYPQVRASQNRPVQNRSSWRSSRSPLVSTIDEDAVAQSDVSVDPTHQQRVRLDPSGRNETTRKGFRRDPAGDVGDKKQDEASMASRLSLFEVDEGYDGVCVRHPIFALVILPTMFDPLLI